MKTINVICLPVIAMVISGLVLACYRLVHEDAGILQLCGIGLVALAVGWIVATLFNLAVFAPVYWLLGKIAGKKKRTATGDNRDA